MTLNEFLKELRKTPRTWVATEKGIRLRQDGFISECPIDAVGGDWGQLDGALALGYGVKERIMSAADGGHSKLRARLLKACGLPQ